jgi:hypothetical protein
MDKDQYVAFNTETEELEHFSSLLDILDRYPEAVYDSEETIRRYKLKEEKRQFDFQNPYLINVQGE